MSAKTAALHEGTLVVALSMQLLCVQISVLFTHYVTLNTEGAGIWACHIQYIHKAHWS